MVMQKEIIIYGLACFQRRRDGTYRVLLPDGRQRWSGVPPHRAALWVRPRNSAATTRWTWTAENNDYFIEDRCDIQINGANATPLDDQQFVGRLASLRDSDPNFTISKTPDAVAQLTIDRGRLTAHKFPTGMTLVRWMLEVEDGKPLRIEAGSNWIDVPADTKQVVLANAGSTADRGTGRAPSHFLLYRRLATVKEGPLEPANPKTPPENLGVTLIDPSHRYMVARTPRVDCSGVFAS